MKYLLAFLLALAACGSQEPCDMLPRQDYKLVLADRDPESFFCFTQAPDFNFTTDMQLSADFADDCQVLVGRGCDRFTTLKVDCSQLEVHLYCEFYGLNGECANDLTALTCHYDAWLDPVRAWTL